MIKSLAIFDKICNSDTMNLTMVIPVSDSDCQITEFIARLAAQGRMFEASLVLNGTAEAYFVLLHFQHTGFLLVADDRVIIDPTYAIANPAIAGSCQVVGNAAFYDRKIAGNNLANPCSAPLLDLP